MIIGPFLLLFGLFHIRHVMLVMLYFCWENEVQLLNGKTNCHLRKPCVTFSQSDLLVRDVDAIGEHF